MPNTYNYIPNGLIDAKINWQPSRTPTQRLLEFERYIKGCAIDIGYEQYASNTGSPLVAAQSLDPINRMQFDAKTWADQLVYAGAQYAILTVATGYGFSLFDQKTQWPVNSALVTGAGNFATKYPSGRTIPIYNKFDIEQVGNENFFAQFCYEMRRVGIEPMVYVPIHVDVNRMGGVLQEAPAIVQDQYAYYLGCWMQELIIRYGIRYFWCDGTDFLIPGFMQKLYNAVKSVTGQNNPKECLIIANSFPGTEAQSWPFDIRSFEYFIYGGASQTFKNTLTINGITYFVPTEMVDCGAQNNYFFQAKPGVTGYQDVKNYSQAFLQNEFDITKQYYSRYALFLTPDYLGNLPTSQIELLKNLQ